MNQSERNLKINTELWGEVRMEGAIGKYPVNKPLKAGKEKLWKTRYFVLADNLVYYDNEDAYKENKKKTKGVICLDFASIALHSTDKNLIALRTPGKLLLLKGSSEEETFKWLEALKKAQRG